MTTTDTRNLEAEVAAIKAEHDAATRNRARAEAARAMAAAQADTLRRQLKEEFAVDGLDEAEQMLTVLNSQLADAINTLRQQLADAGGNA